jgi:hypothetical protein
MTGPPFSMSHPIKAEYMISVHMGAFSSNSTPLEQRVVRS